ncbi:DUF4913 domain-containing protein [Kitasatospora sp. KL5]|uniref:DUF4913 domain-containing protein n=1 Tax=Kitasatospora sp. KL5 TaxID=3425125 RepID=UPI003D6EDBFB
MTEPTPENGTAPGAEEPVFASLDAFVTELFAPMISRKLNGTTTTWCPSWWEHAEAISRLNALWRAWEYLRLDPALGMSTWWLHHADPHLGVLLDADNGPFAACSPTGGHTSRPLPPLPLEPSDPLMWVGTGFTTERHDQEASASAPYSPMPPGA